MSRTPSSGKTSFIQYLTEYYMLLKKIILTATTECATKGLVQKLQLFTAHFIYNVKDMFDHYKN